MNKPCHNHTPLIECTSPTLDHCLLHLMKTSFGHPWADVTRVEALAMCAQAAGLQALLTDEEIYDAGMEGLVSDGGIAEALLGPLNVHKTRKRTSH
jgi:hypothetical protein